MNLLLVGEGDYSFAAALARALEGFRITKQGGVKSRKDAAVMCWLQDVCGTTDTENVFLTASTFEMEDTVLAMYQESHKFIDQLRQRPQQVELMCGVNACALEDSLNDRVVDHIIWNHPHLGIEDFRLHKFLLCHFFYSCRKILRSPQGRVVIVVVDGQAKRWSLEEQAANNGFKLHEVQPFLHSLFPGYSSKRNYSAKSFQNAHTKKHNHDAALLSWTFIFSVKSISPSEGLKVESSSQLTSAGVDGKGLVKDFCCIHCNACFSCQQGLFTHSRQVHELQLYGHDWTLNAEATYKCAACGRFFKTQSALDQHKIAIHSGQAICGRSTAVTATFGYMPCEVCGMAVANSQPYEDHLKMLTPTLRNRSCCQKCGKAFSEPRAAQQHFNFCKLRHRVLSNPASLRIHDRHRNLDQDDIQQYHQSTAEAVTTYS